MTQHPLKQSSGKRVMSRVVYDLSATERTLHPREPLRHPAGVKLPFDGPSDAVLIIPELRGLIRSGSYATEMIEHLPNALKPDDRVLVIGAGLGVISTLVAKSGLAERIIAVEANTLLVPYLQRVHALNGVTEIETVNAVLADGKKGRVPFFARRDLRTSSLMPHDRAWHQVMMVPFMDLNLILDEERISLIISDVPVSSARVLANARLDGVARVLTDLGGDAEGCWESNGLCASLAARGFVQRPAVREGRRTVLFHRAEAH